MNNPFQTISLTLAPTDRSDPSLLDLPWFDYTKLSAINTCPRWGLIRHDRNLAMPGFGGRNLPLEMGGAAHQSFAAIRWFQLGEYGNVLYDPAVIMPMVKSGLLQMFGHERGSKVMELFLSHESPRQRVIAAAQYIAETSGYYDDPSDRRRTLSNLNDSLMGYIDRTDLERCIPVVKGGLIGIENKFNVLVSQHGTPLFYFSGKIDGLMYDRRDKKYICEENKTASRMDDSWITAWAINHQPTGYCVVGGMLLELPGPLDEAYICGMVVPLPKTYDLGGIARIPCSRRSYRFLQWENWLLTTYEMWLRYHKEPLNAPEYTHSCNRYFHSCSFIPLCDAESVEEQQQILAEMEVKPWDPLAEDM